MECNQVDPILGQEQYVNNRSIGSMQVVLQGLFLFLSKIWINRIHEKDKLLTATKLENAKADLNNQILLLQSMVSHLGSSHSALYERKAEAAGKLWNAYLRIKSSMPSISIVYDIMGDVELDSAMEHKFIFDGIKDVEPINHKRISSDEIVQVESLRPFLSERLWFLFFIARAIIYRVHYLLWESKVKNEIQPLHKDPGIKSMLENILAKEQIESFEQKDISRLTSLIQVVEQTLLYEIDNIISNKRASVEIAGKYNDAIEIYNGMLAQMGRENKV
jgi:hypothetical protein